MIFKLLKANTHEEVISLFEEGVDLSGFNVTHTKLWSLYVPKVIKDFCPLLSAHSDTVFDKKPKDFYVTDNIVTNRGKQGIGADDRAGVWIMHELIKKQEQFIYIITDLEERGGVGGADFVKSKEFESILTKASCFIGLDRKGSNDCASYGYDNYELSEIMLEGGYKYAYGSFTDIMTFSENSTLASCNLSIGYENEHTAKESLDLDVMQNTLEFLKVMSVELWTKQYIAEPKKPYSWNSYDYSYDYELYEEIICDVCQDHAPLYNVGWGSVCKKCLDQEAIDFTMDIPY